MYQIIIYFFSIFLVLLLTSIINPLNWFILYIFWNSYQYVHPLHYTIVDRVYYLKFFSIRIKAFSKNLRGKFSLTKISLRRINYSDKVQSSTSSSIIHKQTLKRITYNTNPEISKFRNYSRLTKASYFKVLIRTSSIPTNTSFLIIH